MAKARTDKTEIIRAALTANPGVSNADLVELLNDHTDRLDDKLVFTLADVTAVKRSLKKSPPAPARSEAPPPPAPAPPPETPSRRQPRTRTPEASPPAPSPVELIDKVFDLARECGGFDHLKRLVDRIAEIRRR